MGKLEEEKEKIEIEKLRRNAKLDKYSSYIGFTTNKITGTFLTLVGASEYIVPEFLPLVLNFHPSILIGTGLGFLGGKKFVKKISEILENSSNA